MQGARHVHLWVLPVPGTKRKMAGPAFDQLLRHVEALQTENMHLKQELQDNSSHLTQLESEACTMKEVLTHIQKGLDEEENQQPANPTTENGLDPTAAQVGNGIRLRNKPLRAWGSHEGSPQQSNHSASNHSAKSSHTSAESTSAKRKLIVQPSREYLDELEKERARLLQEIEVEEREKELYYTKLQSLTSRIDVLPITEPYSLQNDMARRQLEYEAKKIREEMEERLGGVEEMQARGEAKVQRVRMIEAEMLRIQQTLSQEDNAKGHVERRDTGLCEVNGHREADGRDVKTADAATNTSLSQVVVPKAHTRDSGFCSDPENIWVVPSKTKGDGTQMVTRGTQTAEVYIHDGPPPSQHSLERLSQNVLQQSSQYAMQLPLQQVLQSPHSPLMGNPNSPHSLPANRVEMYSALYRGGWPLDKLTKPGTPSETASVMSFNSNSSLGPRRLAPQQLGTKVEMVYSLLSMLGTHDKDDMSRTLLAMSSSQDSCIAMRQSGELKCVNTRDYALKTILALSNIPEYAWTLKMLGCLPLLIQLLHGANDSSLLGNSRGSKDARARAAAALHNIVHSLPPEDKRAKQEARVLRLLEQIRAYCDAVRDSDTEEAKGGRPNPADHQVGPAISALMKLSFDEEHRQAMCQLGGLHAVAELLQVDHEINGDTLDQYSITIRRYAGMTLTNLTFGDGVNKATLCSMKSFMRALVSQLKSNSEELRQVTASVLRNLSWRADPGSKKTLREIGSVVMLTRAAMEVKKEATLKSILSALWNLSAHCTENKADICAVQTALAFLVSTLSYKSQSNSLAIIENGGGILRNVSSHIATREDYRQVLRDHNCLQILLDQLRSHSLTIVSNACGTLWNLSARCAKDQETLWEQGAVSMLKNLINSKHKMIAMGSQAALRNLMQARPAVYRNLQDSSSKTNSPGLHVRKMKALEAEIDPTLTETCENVDNLSPKGSPRRGSNEAVSSPLTKRGTLRDFSPTYGDGPARLSLRRNMQRFDSHESLCSNGSNTFPRGWRSQSEERDFVRGRERHSSGTSRSRDSSPQYSSHSLERTRDGAKPKSRTAIQIAKVVEEVSGHSISSGTEESHDGSQSETTCPRSNSATFDHRSHIPIASGATRSQSFSQERREYLKMHRRPSNDSLNSINSDIYPMSPNLKYPYPKASMDHSYSEESALNSEKGGKMSKYPAELRRKIEIQVENFNKMDNTDMDTPINFSLKYSDEALTPGRRSPTVEEMCRREEEGGREEQIGAAAMENGNHGSFVDAHATVSIRSDIPNKYRLTYSQSDLGGDDEPTNFSLRYTEHTDGDHNDHDSGGEYCTKCKPPQNTGRERQTENQTGTAMGYREGSPKFPNSVRNMYQGQGATEGEKSSSAAGKFSSPRMQRHHQSQLNSQVPMSTCPNHSSQGGRQQPLFVSRNNFSLPKDTNVQAGSNMSPRVSRDSPRNSNAAHPPTAAFQQGTDQMRNSPQVNANQPAAASPLPSQWKVHNLHDDPQTFAEEGTPLCFSRVSSLSSLHSEEADDTKGEEAMSPEKEEAQEHFQEDEDESSATGRTELSNHDSEPEVEPEDESPTYHQGGEDEELQSPEEYKEAQTPPEPKGTEPGSPNPVGCEETPLVFSRSSSLSSLSSCEMKSISSSVASEFPSHRASEVVSPSDLPDSPSQSMPQSPRHKKKLLTELGIRRSTPQGRHSSQPSSRQMKGSPSHSIAQASQACEDAPISFVTEGTPLNFSCSTSLSSLTIDEPHINKDVDMRRTRRQLEPVKDEEEVEDEAKERKVPRERSEDEENAHRESFVASEADEMLLDEIISAAMPKNSAAGRDKRILANAKKLLNNQAGKSSGRDTPKSNTSSRYGGQEDTVRRYNTEDTPLNRSNATSMSDLSLMSGMESGARGEAQGESEEHEQMSPEDLIKSESSSMLDGQAEELLAECINSAMPTKSSRPPRRRQIPQPSSGPQKKSSMLPVRAKPAAKVPAAQNNQLRGAAGMGSPKARLQPHTNRLNTAQPFTNNTSTTAPARPFSNEDSIRCYKEEGTPLNFSTATSLSDLTIDSPDGVSERGGASNKMNSQPLQTSSSTPPTTAIPQPNHPRQMPTRGPMSKGSSPYDTPHTYNVEGTPLCFSRNDSLSSLSCDEDVSFQKERQEMKHELNNSRDGGTSGERGATPNNMQEGASGQKQSLKNAARQNKTGQASSGIPHNLKLVGQNKAMQNRMVEGQNRAQVQRSAPEQASCQNNNSAEANNNTAQPQSAWKKQGNAVGGAYTSNFARPEKNKDTNLRKPSEDVPVNYYVEDTPVCFSRNSSLSSLDSDMEEENDRPTNQGAPSDQVTASQPEEAAATEEARNREVARTFQVEDTPLCFSRNSSLSSLSIDSEGEEALLKECISSGQPKHSQITRAKRRTDSSQIPAASQDPAAQTSHQAKRGKVSSKSSKQNAYGMQEKGIPNGSSSPSPKESPALPPASPLTVENLRLLNGNAERPEAPADIPSDSSNRSLPSDSEMKHPARPRIVKPTDKDSMEARRKEESAKSVKGKKKVYKSPMSRMKTDSPRAKEKSFVISRESPATPREKSFVISKEKSFIISSGKPAGSTPSKSPARPSANVSPPGRTTQKNVVSRSPAAKEQGSRSTRLTSPKTSPRAGVTSRTPPKSSQPPKAQTPQQRRMEAGRGKEMAGKRGESPRGRTASAQSKVPTGVRSPAKMSPLKQLGRKGSTEGDRPALVKQSTFVKDAPTPSLQKQMEQAAKNDAGQLKKEAAGSKKTPKKAPSSESLREMRGKSTQRATPQKTQSIDSLVKSTRSGSPHLRGPPKMPSADSIRGTKSTPKKSFSRAESTESLKSNSSAASKSSRSSGKKGPFSKGGATKDSAPWKRSLNNFLYGEEKSGTSAKQALENREKQDGLKPKMTRSGTLVLSKGPEIESKPTTRGNSWRKIPSAIGGDIKAENTERLSLKTSSTFSISPNSAHVKGPLEEQVQQQVNEPDSDSGDSPDEEEDHLAVLEAELETEVNDEAEISIENETFVELDSPTRSTASSEFTISIEEKTVTRNIQVSGRASKTGSGADTPDDIEDIWVRRDEGFENIVQQEALLLAQELEQMALERLDQDREEEEIETDEDNDKRSEREESERGSGGEGKKQSGGMGFRKTPNSSPADSDRPEGLPFGRSRTPPLNSSKNSSPSSGNSATALVSPFNYSPPKHDREAAGRTTRIPMATVARGSPTQQRQRKGPGESGSEGSEKATYLVTSV
ncbi:adenomatous polyposis coli protein-like isoform X2 [Branchiostoma lanceolatum]|uniref:adenomatous polyposis coli protein-like isoform X2 n=1 Tax=Branchiostoma lanceolatum TaxID=7740 RepID=UPI003452988B